MQDVLNFLNQFFETAPKLIGTGQVFKMTPKALDWVQLRTVSRQPNDKDPMLKQAQGSERRSALMVGSAIHDQDEATDWVLFDQQIFQKGDEGLTVLPLGNHRFDAIAGPVISAEDVTAAYSGENEQRFRMMAITQTGGCRSLIPAMAIMQQGNDAGCGIITLAVVGVQWRVNFPHRLSL